MSNFWREKVALLKKYISALYLAVKKKETPWYAKAFAGLVVAYALSPIDFIPDFIPILGYLDDMVLLPLGIYIAIKLIPQEILDQSVVEAEHLWDEGKPKNWLMAIIFILIWLFLVYVISKFLLKWL